MDIDEVAALEELVDGEGQPAARAEHGAEEVRARTQVGDGAQEFQRVALLLQRVGGVRRADQFDPRRAQFPFLPLRRRGDQFALDDGRSAGGEVRDLVVAGRAGVHDHLEVGEAGAVVEFEEGKALGVAPRADPAFDGDGVLRLGGGEDVFNQCAHGFRLFPSSPGC